MRMIILFLSTVLLMTGCTTSKIMTTGKSYKDIKRIEIVNPVAAISCIERGNRMTYNQFIVDSVKSILILDTKEILKDKEVNLVNLDTAGERMYYSEIGKVVKYIEKYNEINNIRLTSRMDSILASNNVDYAMVIIADGFTRLGHNYRNQSLIGVAAAIATLGTFYYAPIKSQCHIRVMIIDRANKSIIFHRRNFKQEIEPLDAFEVKEQLMSIFEDYLKTN